MSLDCFGQANIANILSWHYLWDTYGGFGHDGRRIQPALPSLPSAILKNLAVWAGFFALSPTSKIYKCPWIVFGQANIANILSWHYLWDTYGGFGHDGRRIQPALPSLPSAILKNLAVWAGFFALSPTSKIYKCPCLDCLAKLILPISCHGIIFGTHMEALDMMGEEFSLPFPPYHQQSWRIWLSGPVFFALSPTSKIYKCPGLFGQANIANILSWHYLWDTYGGFGHDGRRIQPALPSLPSAILKNLAVWAGFFALSPTSKIYKCPWIVWPT